MNVLPEGLTPSEDWLQRPLDGGGSKLAAGWSACLCHVRGDWAWYCEVVSTTQLGTIQLDGSSFGKSKQLVARESMTVTF
jgi:hypothetical protein